MRSSAVSLVCLVLACASCGDEQGDDGGVPPDSGVVEDARADSGDTPRDAQPVDASREDAGGEDAGGEDAAPEDATPEDAAPEDAGDDAGDAEPSDADDSDAADAGSLDADDASELDAEVADADPLDGDQLDATDPDAQPADANDDAGSVDSGPTGIAQLNDEFEDSATLSDWTLRDVEEGTPAQYGTLDIDTTTAGHLTIIPSATAQWLHAQRSIFMYKLVTGDFVMRVRVRAVQAADPTMEPVLMFNSGGILARDPASTNGMENWVLMLLGYQAFDIGTRDASTNNSNTSISAIRASTISDGELIICRLGTSFYTYYNTPNKNVWTQTDWFVRNNMPQTLQVGIAIDAGGTQPHLRAEFDWIRFAVPLQQSDCTVDIPRN